MPRKASKPNESQGDGGSTGQITKSEAVRRSIAAGFDQPLAGVAYIKSQYGLEIGPTHFSAVKATEKKKGSQKPRGKPGRKPKAHTFDGFLAPPPKPTMSSDSNLLAALEKMKPLVDALGAEKVKRIADLLG